MIHLLSLPVSRTASRQRCLPRLPLSWPPTLMWIGGVALSLMVALASLPRTAWSSEIQPEQPTAALGPAAAPTKAAARIRCVRCGVVEAIRALEPVGLLPSEYEFTVRLRDGSASVSTVVASTASAWEVGDSIQLIGGL